ncbi:hypothetical protein BASA50_005004, partial [Batrachochytrium salamandrivorans]
MQFFHLFSFVVVASYAAALPQPAGQSEKYSNNVDTNSASGLEARSYQPVFNSRRDSATLVSLKRRDDSEGSAEDNSEGSTGDNSEGSVGKDSVQANDALRAKAELEFKDLASTIDKIRDGAYTFLGDVEKVKQKIDGPLGDMVAKYLGKATYLNDALERWEENSELGILGFIGSGLGEDKYSEIELDLTEELEKWNHDAREGSNEIFNYTTKIADNDGSTIRNFQKIHDSFGNAVHNRIDSLGKLKELLGEFESGKTLEVQLADIIQSVKDFYKEQRKFSFKILKGLREASCANRNAR